MAATNQFRVALFSVFIFGVVHGMTWVMLYRLPGYFVWSFDSGLRILLVLATAGILVHGFCSELSDVPQGPSGIPLLLVMITGVAVGLRVLPFVFS